MYALPSHDGPPEVFHVPVASSRDIGSVWNASPSYRRRATDFAVGVEYRHGELALQRLGHLRQVLGRDLEGAVGGEVREPGLQPVREPAKPEDPDRLAAREPVRAGRETAVR